MKYTLNFLLVVLSMTLHGVSTVCAAELSSTVSADQLLNGVNISTKFWKEDVVYVGKSGGTQIWVVRGYQAPERADQFTCVSKGIALQISRGIDNAVFKIDKKQTSKLLSLIKNKQDCAHINYDDYFLVSGAISIKEAQSALQEINDSSVCFAMSGANCKMWKNIVVSDEDAKTNFLSVATLDIVWVKFDDEDSSIEVRYRPLPGSKNFLVCTITKSNDGTLSLDVSSGLVEGTGIRGE